MYTQVTDLPRNPGFLLFRCCAHCSHLTPRVRRIRINTKMEAACFDGTRAPARVKLSEACLSLSLSPTRSEPAMRTINVVLCAGGAGSAEQDRAGRSGVQEAEEAECGGVVGVSQSGDICGEVGPRETAAQLVQSTTARRRESKAVCVPLKQGVYLHSQARPNSSTLFPWPSLWVDMLVLCRGDDSRKQPYVVYDRLCRCPLHTLYLACCRVRTRPLSLTSPRRRGLGTTWYAFDRRPKQSPENTTSLLVTPHMGFAQTIYVSTYVVCATDRCNMKYLVLQSSTAVELCCLSRCSLPAGWNEHIGRLRKWRSRVTTREHAHSRVTPTQREQYSGRNTGTS